MLVKNSVQVNYNGLSERRKFAEQKAFKAIHEFLDNNPNLSEKKKDEFFNSRKIMKLMNKMRKVDFLTKNYNNLFDHEKDSDLLINHMIAENGYDSWKQVYIFKKADIETIKEELEKMYVQVEGSSWTSAYDCTGREIYNPCRFYQYKDRVVVYQSGALDV